MRPVPDGPTFRVDVSAGPGGRSTVAVSGEIDIATAAEFARRVRDELRGAPVLVDLSEVTFMDSSGVRAIDVLLREREREGWDLLFAHGMGEAVTQVLEITGLSGVLPMAGDEHRP
jgi:anti-sigma B factor antagonist